MYNVQELSLYFPEIYQGVEEIDILVSAENKLIDSVRESLISARNNQYILKADERGIAEYEKIFGITPLVSDTLETRRRRIYMKFVDKLPYTYRGLVKYLTDNSYIFTLSISENNYLIKLSVVFQNAVQKAHFMKAIIQIIPANMVSRITSVFQQITDRTRLKLYTRCRTINIHKHTG